MDSEIQYISLGITERFEHSTSMFNQPEAVQRPAQIVTLNASHSSRYEHRPVFI
jgi:hypothetical protein